MAVVLLASAASSAQAPQQEPVPNELPRSWNLEDIARKTPPYGAKGRVYVLAWKIMEDDRPLRVESCLVLKVLDEEKGHRRWHLVHLCRHPTEKKPEWELSMIHVSGGKGTKYYPGLWIFHSKMLKDRPGNKDIYAALGDEDVGWSFGQEKGWRFVSCGVCEKTWQAAVGERPTRFFGN
jgi:hypothetical protein